MAQKVNVSCPHCSALAPPTLRVLLMPWVVPVVARSWRCPGCGWWLRFNLWSFIILSVVELVPLLALVALFSLLPDPAQLWLSLLVLPIVFVATHAWVMRNMAVVELASPSGTEP